MLTHLAAGIQGKTTADEAGMPGLQFGPRNAAVCVRWFNVHHLMFQCAAVDVDVEPMQVALCSRRVCVHSSCLRAVCHPALKVLCRNVAGTARFGLHKCRIPMDSYH